MDLYPAAVVLLLFVDLFVVLSYSPSCLSLIKDGRRTLNSLAITTLDMDMFTTPDYCSY